MMFIWKSKIYTQLQLMQERTLSGAPPGSVSDGPGRMGPVQLDSVHWTDANEVEVVVTRKFLTAIESFVGPSTRVPIEVATHTFQDFIVEARRLQ
jgi:hypothetical protein